MNATHMIANVVFDPAKAFRDALQRPAAWWPLLAVLGGSALIYLLYFMTVDFPWFVEHTLKANAEFTDEQREAARGLLKPMMITVSSLLATLVVPTAMFALTALYYLLVGQVLGHGVSYGKWFAFCVWTSVPRILAFPLMLYQIASSHGQVAIEDLSMMSLNFLLLHAPNDHPWASLASTLDLTFAWSMAVSVIGFRVWTGERWRTSLVVNAIPCLAVYGLWALRILLSA